MASYKAEAAKLEKENAKLRAEMEAMKANPSPSALVTSSALVIDPTLTAPTQEMKDDVVVTKQEVKDALSGRPPTKPWDKKDGVYRPYRRDYFKLKQEHKGFRAFFARGDERIETLLERGYRIADPAHYGGLVDKIVDDGSSLGRRIVRHGMTLMEIPQEEYDAIQQAKEDHRKALMSRAKRDVKDTAKVVGSEIGHEVKIYDDSEK